MVRHRTGVFGGVQQMIPHRCGPVPGHLYQDRNRFPPKSVLETGLQDGFGDWFLSFFKLQKKNCIHRAQWCPGVGGGEELQVQS